MIQRYMTTPYVQSRQSATPTPEGTAYQTWPTYASGNAFFQPATSNQITAYGVMGLDISHIMYVIGGDYKAQDNIAAEGNNYIVQGWSPYRGSGNFNIPSYETVPLLQRIIG